MKILCSIYDKKAQVYGDITCVSREIDIMRSIQQLSGSEATLALYPDDFTLYRLGTFDDDTGRLAITDPVSICEISTLITKKEIQQS